MNKNKELTKIKETKDMGTEKTDKTEAVSSKIFRAIRHVAAILLTVVVLIWGISVQLDISTIKDRTRLLQMGTPIEKFEENEKITDESDVMYTATVPGSDVCVLDAAQMVAINVNIEGAYQFIGNLISRPMDFWEYSNAYFAYYITSIILSTVLMSKKIMGKKRWTESLIFTYMLLTLVETCTAISYASGLMYFKNAKYIILLLVTYTGILKIKYMFKKNKKYFRKQKIRTDRGGLMHKDRCTSEEERKQMQNELKQALSKNGPLRNIKHQVMLQMNAIKIKEKQYLEDVRAAERSLADTAPAPEKNAFVGTVIFASSLNEMDALIHKYAEPKKKGKKKNIYEYRGNYCLDKN